MKGIVKTQAEYRKNRVDVIVRSIKKAFAENIVVDYEMLIAALCFDLGVSRRHVIELIQTALSQFKHEITKQDERKVIKEVK